MDAGCVATLNPDAAKDLERFGRYMLNLDQTPDAVDYDTPVVSVAPTPVGTLEASEARSHVPYRRAVPLHSGDVARLSRILTTP